MKMARTESEWLYLIDSSVYLFRAYFSLPDSIRDRHGRAANVIHGFTDFLTRFREISGASRAALCFDESLTTSFRNEIDPEYKANRPEAPEDLKQQIQTCKEVGKLMGFAVYASPRYEADDLIGSLANQARKKWAGKVRICVVSTDKDLLQILEDKDHFWNFSKDERISGKDVSERMGVRADQVAELLALTGDTVDNIKGLPGVGPNTAAALLREFGTIDSMLANLESVENLKAIRGASRIRSIIEANGAILEKSRKLTLIESGLTVEKSLERLELGAVQRKKLGDLFEGLGIGRLLLARLDKLERGESLKKPEKKSKSDGTKKSPKKSAKEAAVKTEKKSAKKNAAKSASKKAKKAVRKSAPKKAANAARRSAKKKMPTAPTKTAKRSAKKAAKKKAK